MLCLVHLGIFAQVDDVVQVIAMVVIRGTYHDSNDCHWSVQVMINGDNGSSTNGTVQGTCKLRQ